MRALALTAWCVASTGLAQDGAVASGKTEAEFVRALDEAWTERDQPSAMKATEGLISDGLAQAPTSYELLWRAARYRWWLADGTDESKLRKQVAKEAWNLAERAMKSKPNGPEGRYYTALAIGAYSQAVGVLRALSEGLEGKYLEHLDYATAHNEAFDRYGCRRAKGRYYWELPWPKRDLAKSRAEYQIAIAKHPEHIRNWLYLAETELKDGNVKEAKAAMDEVLSRSIDFDPPEGRRIKRLAKAVAEKIDAELR